MKNSFFEIENLTTHSRTWAEINLTNIKYNLEQIQSTLSKNTNLMAVVKADAYGHGDVLVAQVLLENGVDFLAVSNIDEALSLRNNDILSKYQFKLLILGYTDIKQAEVLYNNNIQQTIYSFEYAIKLNEICMQKNIKLQTQIKIDTGMSRLGLNSNDYEDILSLYSLDNLQVEGIFTHLSSADGIDENSVEYTKLQQDKFDNLIKKISNSSVSVGMTHLQNSAGAITIQGDYDYARVGLMLYGLAPMLNEKIALKPVMALKSVVAMVKEIDKDVSISYGRNFISTKPMKIATIPIGYADGYSRAMSNKGRVLINGQFANILGKVCMDQIIVDVTEIETQMGDVVTLVGEDNGNVIHFAELAEIANTITYELVCMVSKRVPREIVL